MSGKFVSIVVLCLVFGFMLAGCSASGAEKKVTEDLESMRYVELDKNTEEEINSLLSDQGREYFELFLSKAGEFEYEILDSKEDTSHPEDKSLSAANELLMQRICLLMEEQKPFLNCELKVSDVATMLATNSRYISESIKATRGTTFVHFINTYRVTYAQQLLRQQHDIKMTEVYIKSGFANETSFFRTFKAHTGMTPKEWLQTLPDY